MTDCTCKSPVCVWFAHAAQGYIALVLYDVLQAARIFKSYRGRYRTMPGWKETV